MKFDSQIHHRCSIRLKDYDYSQNCAYFVTIVTRQRACLFGEIMGGELALNEIGKIMQEAWNEIPQHFPNVVLDAFVVMPNHIHGIIIIDAPIYVSHVRARHASPLPPWGPKPKSLSAIIGSFKSAVTNRINKMRETPATPFWQRNYYEHVIRDENDYEAIFNYIASNPINWDKDEENQVV